MRVKVFHQFYAYAMVAVLLAAALTWLYPKLHPELVLYKASLGQAGEPGESERLLVQAVESGLMLPEPCLRVVGIYLKNGQVQKARALAEKLVSETRPLGWGLVQGVAGRFDEMGMPERALDLLEDHPKLSGLGLEPGLYRADLYARLKYWDKALALYEELKRSGLSPGVADTLMARTWFWSGDLDAAHRAASRAVDESPGEAYPRIVLARILAAMGENQKAIAQYRIALEQGW